MRSLNFAVREGEVKVLMGGSGCGKSTLLKYLIGLCAGEDGEIYYGDELFHPQQASFQQICRRFGVLFQSGALVELHDGGGELCAPLWSFIPI